MNETLRQLNLALLQAERELRRTTLSSRPAELQIEATNRCARCCPTCARNYYDKGANPPGELSPDLLARLVPLFPTAERVLVGGYGEPLLAEITPTIIAQAHAAGCRSALITGGGDLDDARAARLAEAGLDELILSIDGSSDETMHLRRGVALSAVLAGMDRLRQRRPEVQVYFNITLQVDNLAELPEIITLAGVHSVRRVIVAHQKIYTYSQQDSSALRLPDYARRIFSETETLAAEIGLELSLPPLKGKLPCLQPYHLLAIRHDGLVQGCCSTLFESHLPRVVLGRLPQDDPLALWNAPAMIGARAWIQGLGPADHFCTRCAFRVFTVDAHRRILDRPPDE